MSAITKRTISSPVWRISKEMFDDPAFDLAGWLRDQMRYALALADGAVVATPDSEVTIAVTVGVVPG